MGLQQLYYTSCDSALGPHKRGQVNAASPGLTPTQIENVVRLGACVHPPACVSRPTAGELQQSPLCLWHQLLPDGSSVVAQSRCAGPDGTGGTGSCFLHAIVVPPTEMPLPFLPIRLWRSPDWASTPTSEKQLPVIECPQRNKAITPSAVVSFLQDRYRMERLVAFLTCLQVAPGSGRRIIIADGIDEMAQWIATACYLLPPTLAGSLTFTTCARTPQEVDALIIGTTADVVSQFSEDEMAQAFFVFDFVGWRKSPVPSPTLYASRATEATRAGQMDAFRQFAELMDSHVRNLVPADLDSAFTYCSIATGVQTGGFDALALLVWMADRVEGLRDDSLACVLGLILDRARKGDALSDSVVALYERAQGLPGLPVFPTVERLFLEWLCKSAPGCPADWLEALLDGLSFPESALVTAAACIGERWYPAFEPMEEPLQRYAFLKLVDRLGLLDRAGARLVDVGEKILGPLMPDGAVARYFAELATRPIGRDLLRGVGRYLDECARVNDGRTLARLGWALRREEWCAAWLEQAREERRVFLLLRLAAVKAATTSDRRLEIFTENLQLVRQWVDPPAREIVCRAYRWVWGGATPTVPEALGLLENRGGPVEPEIIRDISAALAKYVEDSPSQEGLVDLARSLQRFDAHERGPKAAVADALILADRARCRSLGATDDGDGPGRKWIEAAVTCATGSLPSSLENELLGLLAEVVIASRAPETHRAVVEQAWSRPAFLEAYQGGVIARLAATVPDRVEGAGDLFRAWARTQADLVDEPWGTLINQHLPRDLPQWSAEEKLRLDRLLAGDPASAGLWARWRQQEQAGEATSWTRRLLERFRPRKR